MTSALTDAPSTRGAPTFTLSPPSSRTGSSTWAPASASSFSSRSTSPSATRYCLPPDSTIANIFLPPATGPGAAGPSLPNKEYSGTGPRSSTATVVYRHCRLRLLRRQVLLDRVAECIPRLTGQRVEGGRRDGNGQDLILAAGTHVGPAGQA